MSQTEVSAGRGTRRGRRRCTGKTRGQGGLWRSPLPDYAHICVQAVSQSLAIDASDKSAFCRKQWSICNIPSVQKEKPSAHPPHGKALTHVNTDWASLLKEHIPAQGCVRRTRLPAPQHAWPCTSLRWWGPEWHGKRRGGRSSEGASQRPSMLLVTQETSGEWDGAETARLTELELDDLLAAEFLSVF